MSNDLRDKGIEIANEAVQADNAGQYESAIQKYCKAAEYLLTATKYEKNPVTLKTIREKCIEYTSRAEALKKGLDAAKNPKKAAAGGGGGKNDEEDEDSGPDEEAEPLTEEQLKQAEAEMEEELAKLVGMEAVKADMRKLCKQLSLDIRRRQQGHAVLDSIRHMMFTGNPGVGKTTVSRLVAKLYKQLGVSSKDHVIEVQKGDLVAGYVNQTAMKTAKKIKEARGGILFVDEAYQLTQALQRGQSDFSGEAIDEMMKVMNESGRKAVTFVFAGYQKEMGEFIQYNAGLESRIKYKFHFADYTVPELVTITNIKLKAKGYKLAPDAQTAMPGIIDKGTDAVLRSKYNGRLTDNLIQWAGDEMNTRLSLDADGDQLITLTKSDLATAIGRFATARPPVKKDPALLGGEQVESQLSSHSYRTQFLRTLPTHLPLPLFVPQVEYQLKILNLTEYSPFFIKAGYRNLIDLVHMEEKDIRALGLTKDADVRRAMSLVTRLKQEHRQMSLEMDALYIDPDTQDMRTWLDKRGLGEYAKVFDRHRIDFEVLGDLTYDDVREIGISEVGPRRKVYRAIAQWRDERDAKKAEAIRGRMQVAEAARPENPGSPDVGDRLRALVREVSSLK